MRDSTDIKSGDKIEKAPNGGPGTTELLDPKDHRGQSLKNSEARNRYQQDNEGIERYSLEWGLASDWPRQHPHWVQPGQQSQSGEWSHLPSKLGKSSTVSVGNGASIPAGLMKAAQSARWGIRATILASSRGSTAGGGKQSQHPSWLSKGCSAGRMENGANIPMDQKRQSNWYGT